MRERRKGNVECFVPSGSKQYDEWGSTISNGDRRTTLDPLLRKGRLPNLTPFFTTGLNWCGWFDAEVREESTEAVLRILHPKIEHQVAIAQQAELVDALMVWDSFGMACSCDFSPLQEIKVQEEDVSFLPDNLRNVIEDPEAIVAQSKKQSQILALLRGLAC